MLLFICFFFSSYLIYYFFFNIIYIYILYILFAFFDFCFFLISFFHYDFVKYCIEFYNFIYDFSLWYYNDVFIVYFPVYSFAFYSMIIFLFILFYMILCFIYIFLRFVDYNFFYFCGWHNCIITRIVYGRYKRYFWELFIEKLSVCLGVPLNIKGNARSRYRYHNVLEKKNIIYFSKNHFWTYLFIFFYFVVPRCFFCFKVFYYIILNILTLMITYLIEFFISCYVYITFTRRWFFRPDKVHYGYEENIQYFFFCYL